MLFSGQLCGRRTTKLTMRECKPLEVMRVFVSGFISIWGLDRDTPHLMAFTCHIKSARSITAFMEAHKVPSFTKVLTQVDNARSNQCHRRIMPCWAPHELNSVEHALQLTHSRCFLGRKGVRSELFDGLHTLSSCSVDSCMCSPGNP